MPNHQLELHPFINGHWALFLIEKMKPEENPLRLSRFDEGVATVPGAFMRGRH
jgi:hypothetical protein